MTTFTQVAIKTRKAIRWGVFFIIFLIVGKFLLGIALAVYTKAFPPPPPPPTLSFGKLPKLPFLQSPKLNLTYTMETPEGGFPKLKPQAKVYFMPKPAAGLLSLDLARERAKGLGFDPTGEQTSEAIYRFRNKNAPSILEMNIVTGAFSISYDLASDSSPLGKRPPTSEVAAAGVRSYLSSANLLPQDLTGPTTNEFLKPESGKLVKTTSSFDANIVKVNFFRKNFDELPAVTTDPNQGNVWFYVSGEREVAKQMVAAEYHYLPVDETKFGTYPVKTADETWKELNASSAYIASVGDNKDGDNVKIRRVFLAYFDSGVPSQFFQPVVVFKGDRNFVAYVPAVSSNYYGE